MPDCPADRLDEIANSLGISYDELSTDLRAINYSLARERLLAIWRRGDGRLLWINPVKDEPNESLQPTGENDGC